MGKEFPEESIAPKESWSVCAEETSALRDIFNKFCPVATQANKKAPPKVYFADFLGVKRTPRTNRALRKVA